jgi:hypothetical protein
MVQKIVGEITDNEPLETRPRFFYSKFILGNNRTLDAIFYSKDKIDFL